MENLSENAFGITLCKATKEIFTGTEILSAPKDKVVVAVDEQAGISKGSVLVPDHGFTDVSRFCLF